MSQKRKVRARSRMRTQVYDGNRLTSEHDAERQDKEVTSKTVGYVRVPSYRPAKGDGNGKAGSKHRVVKAT